jgi:hypothetical protein
VDAKERLDHIRLHGPTPYAFTFRKHFPPSSEGHTSAIEDDRWPCPVG